MKNKILLSVFLFTLLLNVHAQMNFSFTPSIGTFTEITTGTSPFFSGNGNDPLADEGYVNAVPIGFSFKYNSGNNYTELSISTNGFLSFNELSSAYVVNNLSSGAVGERPIIAPLWDDLDLQTTNNITYLTTGTAPNRVFTVQWLNAKWGFGASNAAISFQVKLYETLNWIEFVYRAEAGSSVSPAASVGLTANGTGSNNFISLATITNSPNVSTNTEVANITSKPSTGQVYTFKPGTLPTTLNGFRVTKEKNVHVMNWQTLQEINNAGAYVERSADGNQFSSLGFVASKAINGNSAITLNYLFVDNQPLKGNNYYRLKQVDKDESIQYSSIYVLKFVDGVGFTLNLFPNPGKNKLQVTLTGMQQEEVSIQISSINGLSIMQSKNYLTSGSAYINFDVSNLPTGVYIVTVLNMATNQIQTKRFIK